MRNVAMYASCGYLKPGEFNKSWPAPGQQERTNIVMTDEMREHIMRIHNLPPIKKDE